MFREAAAMRKLTIKDSSPLKEFPIGAGLTIGSLPQGSAIRVEEQQ